MMSDDDVDDDAYDDDYADDDGITGLTVRIFCFMLVLISTVLVDGVEQSVITLFIAKFTYM